MNTGCPNVVRAVYVDHRATIAVREHHHPPRYSTSTTCPQRLKQGHSPNHLRQASRGTKSDTPLALPDGKRFIRATAGEGTEPHILLSTVRGYRLTWRMFCDYVTDPRYERAFQCRDRFGQVPSQVDTEWNTVAHLNDYEGKPGRRRLTYDEVQRHFDHLDDRVEAIARTGRKGSLVALRDAMMVKTTCAFGLRRNELARLGVADLRPNPHVRAWGSYGSMDVRFGKVTKGSLPRRRTVLAGPEFDLVVDGLRQWVELARPLFDAPGHPAWLTERLTRASTRHVHELFAQTPSPTSAWTRI